MAERPVVIIGGGLAGMTVAKELLQQDVPVVILEGDTRLGGKAGSEQRHGVSMDHGYHVFPGWYLNTRQLIRELGIEGNLVDMDRFFHLMKGEFPHFIPFYEPSSVSRVIKNLSSGLMPWTESLLSFYYGIDLASQAFTYRGFLDRVSSSGFLRSRFYATERMAVFHQQTLLQQSAIPDYEISAMTTQKLAQAALATLTPIFSIMNGTLQEKFIQPFEQHLRDLGAEIRFNRCVRKLMLSDGGRVAGLQLDDGTFLDGVGAEDVFVLATPVEVTTSLVDDKVLAAEQHSPVTDGDEPKRLADLVKLKTAHMAAMDLYLKRRIPHIPANHVTLFESRYGLSFIDVSQHWHGLKHTTLSVISSDFEPLRALREDEVADYLLAELQEYIPEIESGDIDRWYLDPNLAAPLFVNTVGAWFFRPGTRTRIENLYVAGDYCRTEADLATMESAVMSGLSTARDLLRDERRGASAGPIPLKLPPRWQLLALKYLALPAIAPLGAWYWLQRQIAENLFPEQ